MHKVSWRGMWRACSLIRATLLLLQMHRAPAVDPAEAPVIRFLFPPPGPPWAVIRDWNDELPVRVDARDFASRWLDMGCSLTLLLHGTCAERACAALRSALARPARR
jgi:hypothetical protein